VAGADGRVALSGFSIAAADSLDQALECARNRPFAEIGTIEVAEMMRVPVGGGRASVLARAHLVAGDRTQHHAFADGAGIA